ncbi:MAG TPA: hypothetical protein PKD64_05680 [Pirellulaceae bacterium]|nr:hypothetical protein [Pirellulaceae bacterium]HMP68366.1 hypothetical protein [Pirellulaceae bacterium]
MSLNRISFRRIPLNSGVNLWSRWQCLAILTLLNTYGAFAQTITLRDSSQINESIVRFDIDSIELQGGRILYWWEVHLADVASDQQELFDALLVQVGDPLMRLRTRLRHRDFTNISEIAAELLDYCGNQPSMTARFAAAALCRGEIANQRRESAALALLRTLMIEKQMPTLVENSPLLELPIAIDKQQWLVSALLPIWFDETEAGRVWQELRNITRWEDEDDPLALLYAASLAIAAGDKSTAQSMLENQNIRSTPWSSVLRAQQLIKQGEFAAARLSLPTRFDEVAPAIRCAYLYHRGIAGLRDVGQHQQQAILDLLQIPATLSTEFPEMSAAAIYAVIHSEPLGNKIASVESLKRELAQKYSGTFHAKKMLNQIDLEKSSSR